VKAILGRRRKPSAFEITRDRLCISDIILAKRVILRNLLERVDDVR